eukprot:Platyproteum_vivax@DN14516_c0_g1_i1.p1
MKVASFVIVLLVGNVVGMRVLLREPEETHRHSMTYEGMLEEAQGVLRNKSVTPKKIQGTLNGVQCMLRDIKDNASMPMNDHLRAQLTGVGYKLKVAEADLKKVLEGVPMGIRLRPGKNTSIITQFEISEMEKLCEEISRLLLAVRSHKKQWDDLEPFLIRLIAAQQRLGLADTSDNVQENRRFADLSLQLEHAYAFVSGVIRTAHTNISGSEEDPDGVAKLY